jgi:hypothetical protein
VVEPPTPSDEDGEPEREPMKGPVTVEQAFEVDGRKLTVHVKFPKQVADEVGLDNLLVAANRAIVTLDTNDHDIEKIRRRDLGP